MNIDCGLRGRESFAQGRLFCLLVQVGAIHDAAKNKPKSYWTLPTPDDLPPARYPDHDLPVIATWRYPTGCGSRSHSTIQRPPVPAVPRRRRPDSEKIAAAAGFLRSGLA